MIHWYGRLYVVIEYYRWLYVNYMNACPNQLEPGKVFCAYHCQGGTSNSVPTSLKEFTKCSKGMWVGSNTVLLCYFLLCKYWMNNNPLKRSFAPPFFPSKSKFCVFICSTWGAAHPCFGIIVEWRHPSKACKSLRVNTSTVQENTVLKSELVLELFTFHALSLTGSSQKQFLTECSALYDQDTHIYPQHYWYFRENFSYMIVMACIATAVMYGQCTLVQSNSHDNGNENSSKKFNFHVFVFLKIGNGIQPWNTSFNFQFC